MGNRFPAGGYLEKILRVDLTERRIIDETVCADVLHQFIGGTGLGIRLLYDELKPGIDPYSPENRVIFATGPVTGTMVPGSGTYSVISKNTLTGLVAAAQANGFFGARLKYSGYDAVVVQGRSDRPVYLHICDGKAELEDASDLVGKDTFETDMLLHRKYGEDGVEHGISVAAIGPAGENLVRYACIVSDRGHVASSGGVGAIMGSKNLKAIVVRGKHGVPIHSSNVKSYLENVKQWVEEAKSSSMGKLVSNYGSIGFFVPYHSRGWVPVKNLTTNIFAGEEVFEAEYIRGRLHHVQPRSCHGCTFYHCHTVEVAKGTYKGVVGESQHVLRSVPQKRLSLFNRKHFTQRPRLCKWRAFPFYPGGIGKSYGNPNRGNNCSCESFWASQEVLSAGFLK